MCFGHQKGKKMFPSNLYNRSYPKPRRSPSDILRWMAGRRVRFSVSGQSMTPTLQEGLFVFVDTKRQVQKGDIVILQHPENTHIVVIKRCIALSDNLIWIEGDNPPQSTDSRQWGWLPLASLIGVCTSIL